MKTPFIQSALFVAMMVAGLFIAGFFGGFLAGMGITLLLLVSAGRYQAEKAAERLDRNIQQQKQTASDGD